MKLFKTYSSPVYALAIFAGIALLFLGAVNEWAVAFGYFVAGSLFAYFWPMEGTRWGIYLGLPVFIFMAASILFAGAGPRLSFDIMMMFIPGIAAASAAWVIKLILVKGRSVR